MGLHELVERLGRIEAPDAAAKPAGKAVARVVAPRPLKDVLSGSWLGHPFHPLLTDIPIGAWTSALALDLVGGRRSQEAADRLIGLGVLAALPTAATGASDWSDYLGDERRIGFLHAMANTPALACYGASYLARRQGARASGLGLSLAGAALVTGGAYLGGHLAYVRGVNVNRNAWGDALDEWTSVAESRSAQRRTTGWTGGRGVSAPCAPRRAHPCPRRPVRTRRRTSSRGHLRGWVRDLPLAPEHVPPC